jgi:protein AFG1
MTTSPGYQAEEWTPLDPSGRTWETKIDSLSNLATPIPGRPLQDRIRSAEDLSDDLAVEAGYSRPGRLTPPPTSNPGTAVPSRSASPKSTDERVTDHPKLGPTRHSPPVIKEQHVWGVADEWGDKAGKWGKGTDAFNADGSKRDGEKDK